MWIKSYVITIILVVLMSILTESLMPDTEMKKHISLVSGLVILFAIAKPIISIPDILSENSGFNFIKNEEFFDQDKNTLVEKVVNLRDDTVQSGFKNKLNDVVSKDLYSKFELSVKTEIVENENKIFLKIYEEENDDVKNYIENTYGIRCFFTGAVQTNE